MAKKSYARKFVVKELLTYNSWMIVKRCPTIQQARKQAYVSLKEDRYPIDIFDENDNLVGYVVTHRPGADAPVYFHPNHHSPYFIKHPLKFNKYLLNRDGSLGRGEM